MAKIKVRCGNCQKEVWIDEYEKTSCKYCGHVITGTKYKQSGGCYITTACIEAAGLTDDCFELTCMRYLRDKHLSKTSNGQEIVTDYYHTAPCIVEKIKKDKNSTEIFHELFIEIKNTAALINSGELETATESYLSMVNKLKKRYNNWPCRIPQG